MRRNSDKIRIVTGHEIMLDSVEQGEIYVGTVDLVSFCSSPFTKWKDAAL